MAEVFFDNPPILVGREQDQLLQLQRYLNAMSDKLNQALMSVSIEQLEPEVRQTISQTSEKTEKNYDSLKTMIIKTAEVVRNEMDEIRTRLESQYTALSEDVGSLEIRTVQDVVETAQGVLQSFNVLTNITALQDDSTENKSFWENLNAYIFCGILDQIEGTVGIAIGKDVTVTDEYGNVTLVDANKTATFTNERLSFWHDNVEMAYFSDNSFHITKGEIMQELKMGNHIWKVLANGAIGLLSGVTE